MALAVYTIVDLEYPRLGVIRVDTFDQALVVVRSSMQCRQQPRSSAARFRLPAITSAAHADAGAPVCAVLYDEDSTSRVSKPIGPRSMLSAGPRLKSL
jgi:hypothetical protein